MVMKVDEVLNKLEMDRSSMRSKKSGEMKRINVSEKRQITIPKCFYDTLGMGREIICESQKQKYQIRPAVEKLIAESSRAAENLNRKGDEQTEELFGDVKE